MGAAAGVTTIELYGRLLEHAAGGEHDGRVCSTAGLSAPLPLRRWLASADAADLIALESATAPVLDVGCGPGRLLAALAAQGRAATGIDVSPVAVRLARRHGHALRASVFSPRVPAGAWGSVLLLDGNIGIGGDAERLLTRTAELLRPGGEAIVEVDPPGGGSAVVGMRLEGAGAVGPWFDWAHVDADAIGAIARGAGLHVAGRVEGAGRWFARLRKVAA
jgi:SAM-dependent methyltransferase